MKRTTLIAIGVVAALVLVPTVMAIAQADPDDTPAATCPYHQNMTTAEMPCAADGQHMMGQNGMGMMGQNGMGMMGQNGMGMMGQNGMGMMGQNGMGMMGQHGMGPEDCPMHDEAQS